MLDDVLDVLRCPKGEPALRRDGESLVCEAGHRYDVARQGYVNLLASPAPAAADTAEMVAARLRVQEAGHLAAVTDAVVEAVTAHVGPVPASSPPGVSAPASSVRASVPGAGGGPMSRVVVDLGSGPGHHLASVLDALDHARGIAVDLSKHAARRAARAHPRIGAVVADVWDRLPVRGGTATVVLDVFSPRNVPEIHRILADDGLLVVVTPDVEHLAPLPEALRLLAVAPDKPARLDRDLARAAVRLDRVAVRDRRPLDPAAVRDVIAMGPNAHHTDPAELDARVGDLATGADGSVEVTVAVTVSVYRRAPGA